MNDFGLQNRRSNELLTTLTLDNDMAAAANAGGKNQPVVKKNTPIAKGIPMRL